MPRRPHVYGTNGGHLAVVLDCADLARAAEFWTGALGYVRAGESSGPYQVLVPADGEGIELLLQRVGDKKTAKSRLHLDLRTKDLQAEMDRLLSLGATQLTSDAVVESGWRWHVLADPDGNELCVLEPPSAYWKRTTE